MIDLSDKRILITGGTGSFGKVLLQRLISGRHGRPRKIVVFSRDEAKQHDLRLKIKQMSAPTDEVIYHGLEETVQFHIGDVRDFRSVASALRDVDIVVNAAALKQVPTCEYFPTQALDTNVHGPENIVRAIAELDLPVETVVGVSTDKAVKPVNVMGLTKALQERVFANANLQVPTTRFVIVRYGNVLASRGSVIPLFREQVRRGGPVTITSPQMTRFLLSLDDAVDVVMAAIAQGRPGATLVPIVPSALITNVAKAIIDKRPVRMEITGIRPGEKIHEVLISEEEIRRTTRAGKFYSIAPILPELASLPNTPAVEREYSSANDVIDLQQTRELLRGHRLLLETEQLADEGELLR